jgi:molybdopterin converting factor small subunit
MIKITVKLIGPFVYKLGFSEKELTLPEGTTVDGLCAAINLDPTRPRVITRNGRAVAPAEKLEDGDRIVISPLYSGG